jgi:DNA-binding transcriptional LysR family regulator
MKHQRILGYVDAVVRTGSFRKAAERVNVTGSALTRRILDLEKELGAPLFERKSRGVRLTSAGEIFVAFARAQIAEAQRLASRIEDLRGLRRGTVRLACSQAVAHAFLPQVLGKFADRHPLITFQVEVLDHEAALAALSGYLVDLVLVYRPTILGDLRPLIKVPQRLVALFPADHKLKGRGSLRLRECVRHPLALPQRPIGGRQLLDEFSMRTGTTIVPAVESNSFEFLLGCVRYGGMVSFQIEIGVARTKGREPGGVSARPIDERDVPCADLVLGQLRGRNLPVAAALFAELLMQELAVLR